jgi:hypothetical protein
MTWRIHTGPFPFVVPGHDGDLWLWRITDGLHFTSVTVNISGGLRRADRGRLSDHVREAIETRGSSAVSKCLDWSEPPREITFQEGKSFPGYWGGGK